MLNIAWEWLPLIITLILIVFYEIAKAMDAQMQIIWGALGAFALTVSIFIYTVLGLIWLYNHINVY